MAAKFLVIGDPHFKTSNIPDTEDFIEKTIQLALKERPNYIILLGDVLHEHERLHTIPLNKAYEFIKAMSEITMTYILVGNHDMINNQQFLTDNHWMNGLKQWDNIVIVDHPVQLLHNERSYVFCPYVPNGRFREALDTTFCNSNDSTPTSDFDWKTSTIIFAHQEFKDCKMGAIVSQDGDLWDKSLPPVISGHIHSNQKLLDGHIYYPGSAMQNAFGDPNNILAIISIEDHVSHDSNNYKPYLCTEIDLLLRKKKIIYHDLDTIDTLDLDKIINSKDEIKLSLSGTYDDFKVFTKTPMAKKLVNNGTKLVHKNKSKKITSENSTQDDPSVSSDEQNSHEITINDTDDSLEKLVQNFIIQEQNNYIVSDFNYVFLNAPKDQEIIML